MNQEKALRSLYRAHGRTIVNRLLPVVKDRGFGSICEISVNHPWFVEDNSIQIPNTKGEWKPMFSWENSELWETAAGYVRTQSATATVLTKQGEVSVEMKDVGSFLAGFLKATARGKVYADGETSQSLYLKRFTK